MNLIVKTSAMALTLGLVGHFAQAMPVDLPIVNGGFETDSNGDAGATGWTIDTNHFWTSDGSSTGGGLDPVTGADGTTNFLSPNRVAGGAGANPASSFASQSIDLSSYASEIDADGVTLDVDFWYVNSKNTDERTVVSVEFFDGSAGSLGVTTTNDLTQSAAPQGSWTQYSTLLPEDYLNPENGDLIGLGVPTGTRSFTLTLNQRRLGGSATNTGLDEVSAQLILPDAGLPGDTDGDGDVDDSDLGTSFSNYTGPVGDVGLTAADGDNDGDGDVDDSDLGTSFSNYTGPIAVAVPEPTSLALLGLGALLAVRRRRA